METDPGWDLPHKLALAAGILLYLLALTGELLGWWNDLGLILALAGLSIGVCSDLDMKVDRIQQLLDDRLPGGA